MAGIVIACDCFKAFARAIQEFAGGPPDARRVEIVNAT